jgi:hypothetical protein
MLRHSVCYNSCGAIGLSSETLPLPNHRKELYISQYSSNHPQASFKRSYLDDNLLICFTGFGSTCPCWIAMDANTHGEGPSRMNNEELNPHDEALNELYGKSQEDGKIDPLLDFNLPSEGDVTMEDVHSIHPKSGHNDWMKTVIVAAKGSKYSGEDTGDFAKRSQLVDIFKYLVNEAIRMSHVPA